MNMLEHIRQRLESSVLPPSDAADAAVLVALTARSEPELILTLRAAHLSRHPGQVAFPGGHREAEDRDLVATALRESREEIALDPASVEVIGTLPQRISRYGVRVSPVVAVVPEELQLEPNLAELDEIYRIPLPYFLERENLRIDRVQYQGRPMDVPWFPWGERQVWGLTALMLLDLLEVAFDFRVELLR